MTRRRAAVVLFDGFELLDVFGPVELLHLTSGIAIDLVGAARGPVASSQGCSVVAEHSYEDVAGHDILLVPGGAGTRSLVSNQDFLNWLRETGEQCELVASVCTGSALLAAAGLLEHYRATTNKRAYSWATSFGEAVEWVPEARWVHDRDRWSSSGIAAGMDMTAALIANLLGPDVAREATERAELEVHTDSAWDPFARLHGLV